MELSQNLPSGVFNVLLALTTLFCFAGSVRSTRIVIRNNCSHTVWAAANPGGGKELRQGDTWTLPNVTGRGRIWGRTNCAGFGHDGLGGRCESGDCGGRLECETDGRAPNTVAEYSLNDDRETDGFYISVVEGFNIPMEFGAAQSSTEVCAQATRCAADVNAPCPMELRDPGGCNNPCTVFQNNQFCCTATGSSKSCGPTSYSKFFEDLCPEAVTYPHDNAKRSTCQTGIEYSVVFCPSETETDSSTQLYNPIFELQNNCSYPIWAAALPGGSKRLDRGESWFTNREKGTAARIWGRTNCSFDAAGKGKCETGDCSGVFECKVSGSPPVTVAEYILNQFSNLDFFDISLVDGFNVPMEFVPTSNGCFRGPRCAADLSRECPKELRAPGGCQNPCTVFKTAEYCCTTGPTTCGPTNFSRYFKDRCPNSYSYPLDDQTSTFTCPGGAYYKIVFCP